MRAPFPLFVAALSVAMVACRAPSDPAERLEAAASEAARFLTGRARYDALDLADTVDLYVAPDGGGGRARLSREQLRDPSAWRVESGGQMRSFVPRGLATRLVSAVGQYMNCQPSQLSTRFPHLSSMPHVGIRLEPPNAKSCLQTWNATFVYDTAGGRMKLVAAIYDQWEW